MSNQSDVLAATLFGRFSIETKQKQKNKIMKKINATERVRVVIFVVAVCVRA